MKQYINLLNALPQREAVKLPAKVVVRLVLLFIVILLGIYAYGVMDQGTLKQALKQSRVKERQMARSLVTMSTTMGKENIEGQVMHLAKAVAAKERLVTVLKRKRTMNTTGYSAYLLALAELIPNDVWLTHINISKGSSEIGLEGKATTGNRVLPFLSRLDDSAVFQGRQFKLAKLSSGNADASPKLPKTVARFILRAGNE